ncbi:methylenetetrahydrofolate reductase [Desulfovibrio sp. OttesenSCG-928-F07]|nr:methylenetetrahydrofolate reductase [Desulfovibrio sp. OttesenSCG-928-F07]
MKISELIKNSNKPFYSLEFFPPKEEEHMPAFFDAANKLKDLNPLFVSVTYGAGGSKQANTLEVARSLKTTCGFEPMTHLTCVGSQKGPIKDYLQKITDNGINNILALRGDAPKNQNATNVPYDWSAGDFQHASDLVSFVRHEFSDMCIGVTAYPAPHPEAESREKDLQYAALKVKHGGDFLVTQLFFDVNEYVELVNNLRALGVDKPVVPGIMPVQSLESIKYVMSMCGANIPQDYYNELKAAHQSGGTAAVREIGTAFAAEQVRKLIAAGAPGVHLYTLNKSETCLKIAELVGGL